MKISKGVRERKLEMKRVKNKGFVVMGLVVTQLNSSSFGRFALTLDVI